MTLLEIVAKHGILREGSNGQHIKILQQALRNAGHELVVDGDFGTITRAAVERFQAAARIATDGMVGPITATYLDAVKEIAPERPLPSVLKTAPWLSYMRALTGTKEIPGTRSNPLILSWVRSLGARYPVMKQNISWYVQDDTPWCGLGCAEAVGECDPGYMPPIAPLRALNWAPWGVELPFGVPGAIGVKARKGGGHVTLYESESGGKVYMRGPNQSNMINVGEYNKKDFIAWRWPVGAVLPIMKPLIKKYDVTAVTEA